MMAQQPACSLTSRLHRPDTHPAPCPPPLPPCIMHSLSTSKGMAEVKAAGKYRQEGKSYVVQDGDIIHFQFNVTSAKKK
jgi:hypothetical protein